MKRLVTCGIVAALVCCACVVANGKTEPETKAITTSAPVPAATDVKRNEKLRADVQRLVSDAKAGKLKVPAQQFPAPTQRNNMSTGAKIAIVAIIAGTVFLIFMFHAINSD